jgi:phosphate transport system substrate-binding protein
VLLVGATLAALGCSPPARPAGSLQDGLSSVRVHASGPMMPVCLEAANQYMRLHRDVLVTVDGDHEAEAARLVVERTFSLALTNLPVNDDEDRLDARPFADAPLALLANSGDFDAAVDGLTQAQLRALVSGHMSNWRSLGGGEQRIVVIDRRGSGEHAALARLLGLPDFSPALSEETRAVQVQSSVVARLGAISYAALPYRHPAIKTLALDGVQPSVAAARDGRYPLLTRERVVMRRDADAATRAFVAFLYSPELHDDLLDQLGYVVTGGR